MAFAPPPEAKGPLNRYRILSPNAAVRVSPLCFGAMNLGTAWGKFMQGVNKEEAFKLLDYYYDQGGNFIDVVPLGNMLTLDGKWVSKRRE
jgi:aryl-alcohol dehydrogenase-like predicted oxidoreductase